MKSTHNNDGTIKRNSRTCRWVNAAPSGVLASYFGSTSSVLFTKFQKQLSMSFWTKLIHMTVKHARPGGCTTRRRVSRSLGVVAPKPVVSPNLPPCPTPRGPPNSLKEPSWRHATALGSNHFERNTRPRAPFRQPVLLLGNPAWGDKR